MVTESRRLEIITTNQDIDVKLAGDVGSVFAGKAIVKAKDKAKVLVASQFTEFLSPPTKPVFDRDEWTTLIDKYRHNNRWLYPIPWDKKVRFDSSDFSVVLKLVKPTVTPETQRIPMKALFDHVANLSDKPKRVLMLGDPGCGKSILCEKIAWDWSQGVTCVRQLRHSSVLILLYKLGHLGSDQNLENELFHLLHSNYVPKDVDQPSPDMTKQIVCSLEKSLVILLDGYDQISAIKRREVGDLLRDSSLFRNASFLVTCRATNDKNFTEMFDKELSVDSITEEKADFLKQRFHWSSHSDCQTPVRLRAAKVKWCRFKDALADFCQSKSVELHELSPLLLQVIFWIVSQDVESKMKGKGNDDLSSSFLHLLAEHHNAREDVNYSKQHIADVLDKLRTLCMQYKNEIVIPETKLKVVFQDDYLLVIHLGILKSVRKAGEEDVFFEPCHKIFFEFLINSLPHTTGQHLNT